MTLIRYALMTLLALLAAPAAAQTAKPNITATLIAESKAPAPGRTVMLALAMKPAKTWHGYWSNPGDAGVGPQFKWTLPQGVTAGEAQFPVPHRLLIAGLMNHVYEGDYAHLIPLTLPANLAPGTKLPIRLQADWLACTEEICVPESGSFAIDLTVGDGAADAARAADFGKWRAALPRPLGVDASFQTKDGVLRIAIPLPASATVKDGWFFAFTDGALDYAAPQTLRREGDTLFVEAKARDGAAGMAEIEGIIALDKDTGLWLEAVPGTVEPKGAVLGKDGAAADGAGGGLAATIATAFGLAILGGLLLNIMPCVFPILSLKALSLAKAGGDEAAARREGLAYTGGVVLVCLALGGVLLALRAGGMAAGWAFQLQDPRVILSLLLLTSAIALNLAGLFEIGSLSFNGAAGSGTSGAFWTGALAAFIATPCTGPFMGVALGAALVLPPLAALAIFAGLGLGLALPFLLLVFVPALRRRLPKPGAWMEMFRRILSIPMFLTALGLAWILGRQSGVDGMTMGLAAVLALAGALWWIGARQARGRGGWLALAPALAAVAALMIVLPKEAAVAAPAQGGMLAAEPFTEARLAALRTEGRPVFVYFTADWCLTCKVNEKAAIERAEVADAFKAKQVAVLVGDWTDGDPVIGRFIESQGRSGVPLYLYYKPGGEPQILPQVLTPSMLTALAG